MCQIIFVIHLKLPGSFLKFWDLGALGNCPTRLREGPALGLCYCCSFWVFVVIYVKNICSLHCWVLGILKLERERERERGRESFLNWVGDVNYVMCIGVKLCNGSGVVCTFTALLCSLWNLKVYLNFSLVWKPLTWGNDTDKRPFWLWYAWLIFCQIDFFWFLSKVEESWIKMRIGGFKIVRNKFCILLFLLLLFIYLWLSVLYENVCIAIY